MSIEIPQEYFEGIENDWLPVEEAIRVLEVVSNVEFPPSFSKIMAKEGLVEDRGVSVLKMFTWFNAYMKAMVLPEGYVPMKRLMNIVRVISEAYVKASVKQGKIRTMTVTVGDKEVKLYNVNDSLACLREAHRSSMSYRYKKWKEDKKYKRPMLRSKNYGKKKK